MMSKVSDKSTKAEIWAGYQNLLGELAGRPVNISSDMSGLQNMSTVLGEAKTTLVSTLEATLDKLAILQQTYNETDQEILRRKTAVLEALEQDKKQLETTISDVRALWQQEQTDIATKRQREEDEYTYGLTRKRRDEQEAYDQKTRTRETVFAEREKALKEHEEAMQTLTAEAATFPTRLENETKAIREETTKALKVEYEAAFKDAKQTAEHEKSILTLKLQTADVNTTVQNKQIVDLQRQLESAQSQLKDMAVTVIESNRPSSGTST